LTHRILIVDDDLHIREVIRVALRKAGMTVFEARDGKEALTRFAADQPDLIVLDIGMPEFDGLDVCREIRKSSDVPILFLSARDEEIDRVLGLEIGGDDYVTKPFSPRELVARVQAMLRRVRTRPVPAPAGQGRGLVIGDLVVDEAAREVRLGGEPVALTRIEFDLLAALAAHPQLVLSRRQLVEMVWDTAWTGDAHLVDVHIGRIRKKLGDTASGPRFIHTIRGVGYRMGTGR
jgi:DNA-binding response OmpR family regulator